MSDDEQEHDIEDVEFTAVEHQEEQISRLLTRPQSAFRFCLNYEPPIYLIEPVVRTGTLVSLTAGTGTGKTGWLISACLAVASGRSDVLQARAQQGTVVLVTIENPNEVRARLMAAAKHFGILLRELGAGLVVIPNNISPEHLVQQLERLTEMQGEISLIAIDSFSAMFDGKDFTNPKEAGDFLRRLRPLNGLFGSPAVVIATHPNKGAGNDDLIPTGSGMILNEVDGNLVLKRNASAKTVQLHHQGKWRGVDFAPIDYAFILTTSPRVVDSDDREIPTPVMVRHVPPEPARLALVDARQSSAEALLKAMIGQPDGSTRSWANTVGCSQAMVRKHLKRLADSGFAVVVKNVWSVTAKGLKHVNPAF